MQRNSSSDSAARQTQFDSQSIAIPAAAAPIRYHAFANRGGTGWTPNLAAQFNPISIAERYSKCRQL
jgi:hypothetical protein